MNSTQLSVSILDEKNYNRWCVQMRVLFDYHELWDVIEGGVSALGDNATEAQWVAHRDKKKKNKKALYLIHQGINAETFEQIEGATTANEAWTILSTNYKGDDKIKRVRLQTLRLQYELLQMETTKTIDVYINNMKTISTGWLETPSYAYVTSTSRILAFTRAFPVMNTWKCKDKRHPRGRLHSNAQVSTRARKHRNCIILLLCVFSGAREFSLVQFVTCYIETRVSSLPEMGFFWWGEPNTVVTLLLR